MKISIEHTREKKDLMHPCASHSVISHETNETGFPQLLSTATQLHDWWSATCAPSVGWLLQNKKWGCLLAVVCGSRPLWNWPTLLDCHTYCTWWLLSIGIMHLLTQRALPSCGITEWKRHDVGNSCLFRQDTFCVCERVRETVSSSELKVMKWERYGDRQGYIPTSNYSGQSPRHFNKALSLLQ